MILSFNKILILDRIAFQTYRGHMELIKDVINRHSPYTFANTNDAFKPVSIYFKRMHELRSRHKKLAHFSASFDDTDPMKNE